MKLLRYFIRGVQEVARDLGIVKRVVKPRRVEPPLPGRATDILRYLVKTHTFRGMALYDPSGSLVASTFTGDQEEGLYDAVAPLMEEHGVKYLFFRKGEDWIIGYRRRGFLFIILSPYLPDVVDLWMVGREFERYMWGSSWED